LPALYEKTGIYAAIYISFTSEMINSITIPWYGLQTSDTPVCTSGVPVHSSSVPAQLYFREEIITVSIISDRTIPLYYVN